MVEVKCVSNISYDIMRFIDRLASPLGFYSTPMSRFVDLLPLEVQCHELKICLKVHCSLKLSLVAAMFAQACAPFYKEPGW